MPFEEYNAIYQYISEHRNDTFPFYDELISAVLDLGELTQKDSEYKNMEVVYENKQTLKELVDLRRKMGRVMDSVSIYLDVYKSKKKDTAGTDITRMVRNLKTSLETEYKALRKVELDVAPELEKIYEDELESARNAASQKAFQERLKEANPNMYNNSFDGSFNNSNVDINIEEPKDAEPEEEIDLGFPMFPHLNEMEKASRIFKNVGDSGIKPKLSSYQAKPGIGGSIWGSVKHYMFQALSLVALPINGVFYGFTSAYSLFKHGFRRDPAAVSQEHPLTGETEADYLKTLKQVAEGRDDQAILNDRRKIPQNYEVSIPEDPDQPPVFAIHIIQSQEGDQNAINANGDTGHSFVSLKYTKVNPITGKKERYMTKFGLYMKGGFGGKSMNLSSVATGLYQPAQINDESGKLSDVSVEYTVSNKDINNVILAAQQYEKGGYNTIERNCTNFAYDMGKAAGLGAEVDKYFNKAHFTSSKVQWKLAAQPFVGFAASRIASDELYAKSKREDYSIQRFGKKMVDPEDIKHISKQSLNKEMYGYFPNRVAESYRADRNIRIDSTLVKPGVTYNRSRFEIPRNAVQPFLNDIRTFAQAEQVNDIEPQLRNLEAYLIKRVEMFETVVGNLDKPRFQTKENYFGAVKMIKETVDGLNQIYKEYFKSRPELNIPFHQMIASFNYIKEILYLDYNRNIAANSREVNPDLDASRAIRGFYGSLEFIDTDMSFSSYAAKLQAFGTPKNMIIYHADPNNDLVNSPEGEKAYAEMSKKVSRGLVDSLQKAQYSYLEDRPFNRNDYKRIFSDIPNAEKIFLDNRVCKKMYATNVFQPVALQHLFGGTKKELSSVTKAELEENPALLEEMVQEILERKLDEQSHELTVFADGLADGLTEEYLRKDAQVENDWDYNNLIAGTSLDRIEEAIRDRYIQPIFDDLATDLANREGWNIRNFTARQKRFLKECFDSQKVSLDDLVETMGVRVKDRLDMRTYLKERSEVIKNGRLKSVDKAYALANINSEILARADIKSDPEIIKESLAGLLTAELYIEYKEGLITKGPAIKNYEKEVAKLKSQAFMDEVIKDPDVLDNIKILNSEDHDMRKQAYNQIVEKMIDNLNPRPRQRQRENIQREEPQIII